MLPPLYRTCTSVLVVAVVILQHASATVPVLKYECTDSARPLTQTFVSVNEYQKNTLHFDSKYNHVAFNVSSLARLDRNIFITYESNFIRQLSLNGLRIETVDMGAFNELFCVTRLLLQDNTIAGLDNGTFDGLHSLEELNLRGNNIMTVAVGSFRNLNHLLKLDLSHNRLMYITVGTFDSLDSLWELRLNHNQFTTMPADLFQNVSHVKRLHLGHNLLATLTGTEFKYLARLDFLDLSGNMIRDLVEQLFRALGRLTELNVAGNELTQLNVNALPRLERIHLEENPWQCSELTTILAHLHHANIGVVINRNTVYNNIALPEVGCLNGTQPWTTTTTSTHVPWYPSSPTRHMQPVPADIPYVTVPPAASNNNHDKHDNDMARDDRNSIRESITQLRNCIIAILSAIIVLVGIYFVNKSGFCTRYRRRFTESTGTEASLPLLLR